MATIILRDKEPVKQLSPRVRSALEDILHAELALSLARQLCVSLDETIVGPFQVTISKVSTRADTRVHIECREDTQRAICTLLADLPQLMVGDGYLLIGNPTEPHLTIHFRSLGGCS